MPSYYVKIRQVLEWNEVIEADDEDQAEEKACDLNLLYQDTVFSEYSATVEGEVKGYVE